MLSPPALRLAGLFLSAELLRFLIGYGLDRSDGVLKFRDPSQSAVGRHRVGLCRLHDEVALARLEAVEQAVEIR